MVTVIVVNGYWLLTNFQKSSVSSSAKCLTEDVKRGGQRFRKLSTARSIEPAYKDKQSKMSDMSRGRTEGTILNYNRHCENRSDRIYNIRSKTHEMYKHKIYKKQLQTHSMTHKTY